MDELQTALAGMADLPLVQSAIAAQVIQDIILQDITEVLYMFISKSHLVCVFLFLQYVQMKDIV